MWLYRMPRFTRIDALSLPGGPSGVEGEVAGDNRGFCIDVGQHGGEIAVVRVRVTDYGQIVRIGRSKSKEQSD